MIVTRLTLLAAAAIALTTDIAAGSETPLPSPLPTNPSIDATTNSTTTNVNLPGTCQVENNFDYVGNDLSNVQDSDSNKCCDHCTNAPQCGAWTWSDFNGGTCWLKTGRGQVVAKQGVKSGLIGAMIQQVFFYNIDIVGNNIANKQSNNPASCGAFCQQTLGCRAYTHTTYNGGTCWLKSNIGRTIYTTTGGNPISGSLIPQTTTTNHGIQQGVDIVGGDIDNVSNTPVNQCYDACLKTKGCRAYSWTSQNGGTCWLKNIALDMKASQDVTSGVVFPNPAPPSGSVRAEYDVAGAVIEQKASADPYDCISLCWATRQCNAFTWNNYNGGTCYLKGITTGAPFPSTGVKMAFVRM